MAKINHQDAVKKFQLENGLTVLVRPVPLIPKVSIQLWYNVGSKDERDGQRGIAHLIEHMIFKGTKKLTESDINLITQKLSGYCNAFTSYDYTGYLFDLPSHHWHEALAIMADCMTNCTFKKEFLASEMKAVIQELKMYRDDYASSLVESMISTIFPDHPYHYPIIGFKQDLWSVSREELVKFYEKHYVPNNATLVVVGDVTPDEVYNQAKKVFGHIPAKVDYKKQTYYSTIDVASKGVTLFRDVQQPTLVLAWTVPGAREKKDYYFDVLSWLVGRGKSSLLYKILVDEKQIATDIEAFCYDLFDRSLFFVYVQPKNSDVIQTIIDEVHNALNSLGGKVSQDDILRAMNQVRAQYANLLEDIQKQAYVIGQSYLATGDDEFLFNYLQHDEHEVSENIKNIVTQYLRPSLTNIGKVLMLSEQDKDYWRLVQERSDQEDARILSGVKRTAPIEEGKHVHEVKVLPPKPFTYPRARKIILSNNVPVYYYNNDNVSRVQINIALKAKHYYDPENLQGLYTFLTAVMGEGTVNYTAQEFARTIETHGMSLSIAPGRISMNMPSDNVERGLHLLTEVLTQATLPEHGIEKVRKHIIADLKEYWDSPRAFAGQLAREQVYKNHPYSKKVMGDFASISAITRDDLLQAYTRFISPGEAAISIVGDIEQLPLEELLQKTLATWKGDVIEGITFPAIAKDVHGVVQYPINRDQIVLCYAGTSISRLNKNFDAVLLFDQIFTGGVLGSMSSRLFALRERSGLFYTIGGSLMAGADEQPGMTFIRTIVSMDRLAEAELAIDQTISYGAQDISQQELEDAKRALSNSLVENFSTNQHIAETFLFLHRYGLPQDYFDKRAIELNKITASDIKPAVEDILNLSNMVKIKIGRF